MPKDKFDRQSEQRELVAFARRGGTPKGAPHCYGGIRRDKTKRQVRACRSCDENLRLMCDAYAEFLVEYKKQQEKEYKKQKAVVDQIYAIRSTGRKTSVGLERARRKKNND